jgi:ATP-dependent Lon protease
MTSRYNLRSSSKKKGSPPPDNFDYGEYLHLLKDLFPSKYISNKAATAPEKVAEKITEKVAEPDECDSDYETVSESDHDSDYETVDDSDYETVDSESDGSINIMLSVRDGRATPKGKLAKQFSRLLSHKQPNPIEYYNAMMIDDQQKLLEKLRKLKEFDVANKPVELAVIDSAIPDEYKMIALKKIAAMRATRDGEHHKLKMWVDAFLKIPFGTICKLPVTMDDGVDKCAAFMDEAKRILDETAYGLEDAKEQLMQYIGQLIANPMAMGTAIAIKGPMGTGKTTLIRNGISKILQRPFASIALGGATDSSYLEGHLITYEGSVWGQLVDILMRSKCMNPVIYFDELDKISETPKGAEITGILTHLTDLSQNTDFQDKFFSELKLDFSQVLFIFSYNDESKVNPILRDRMYVIETEGYTVPQKMVIVNQHLAVSIGANIRINPSDVVFTDEAVAYIVERYTAKEKGVRNLKRCVETIYSKLNMDRLTKRLVTFPVTVTPELVRGLLKAEATPAYQSMYL